MNEKIVYVCYEILNQFRRICNAVFSRIGVKVPIKCKYNKIMLDLDDANKKISEILKNGKPALIARFGSNEAHCVADAIGVRFGVRKNINKKILGAIHNNAGVFPEGKEMAMRFSEICIKAAKQVDLLGAWNSNMQDYLINNVCPEQMMITKLGNLEPYNSSCPWSKN